MINHKIKDIEENFMVECLVVGAGGFIGAMLRYLMGLITFEKSSFPIMTLIINMIGAFMIGIVVALASKYHLDSRLVLFLKAGVCGGFTTFSTFSLESMTLLSDGRYLMATGYILLSVSLCLLFVYLGTVLVELM